ncbi:MAG TPA: SDR family oxidoreductase [Chloroflexota bacterium]|nr:SDR family oxidoreductase [Chloroflexota bacterium]
MTGATGALGRRLACEVLRQSEASLVVLSRCSPASATPADFVRHYLPTVGGVVGRVQVVHGDVTVDGIGIPAGLSEKLQCRVTTIIHAAAVTRFDQSLAFCRAVNVRGTANVLQWAGSCRRLTRFALLSTPYVAGRRVGTILESELAHEKGFANTYEQSKYEAEIEAERWWHELPLAVYRTSTVLGDAGDGQVDRFTAPHFAFRLLWTGMAPMFPGRMDCPIDLIPGDYAARATVWLLLGRFKPQARFHIAAGPRASLPVGRLIDQAYEIFGHLDPEWARRGYAKPPAVDAETYALFRNSVMRTANPLYRRVLEQLDSFSEQLLTPKAFDIANVLAELPDYEEQMPRIESYLPEVLRFCVHHDWKPGFGGRGAAALREREALS